MALMKVLNYGDNSRISWNYYPLDDLLAYGIGCGHPQIENEAGSEDMPLGGVILNEPSKKIILLKFEEEELSEEQRIKLFGHLKELLKMENLQIDSSYRASFYDRGCSSEEISRLLL
jgi:hypothetical protein